MVDTAMPKRSGKVGTLVGSCGVRDVVKAAALNY